MDRDQSFQYVKVHINFSSSFLLPTGSRAGEANVHKMVKYVACKKLPVLVILDWFYHRRLMKTLQTQFPHEAWRKQRSKKV